ncbi:MAG: BlaI/MecI/CopY family transcriptional regulator, partial [Lysobacterales bacterium]
MGVAAIDLPRPTNAELGILRVLWSLGPSTVRKVHEYLQIEKATVGYTTVLKFLQIMHGK